jgi:rod shape-determining protein MreC
MFSQGYSLSTRLVLLIILSVLLMWMDNKRYLDSPKDIAGSYGVNYFNKVASFFGDAKTKAETSWRSTGEIKDENKRLREKIHNLRNQNIRLRLLQTEVKKYRRYLNASRKVREHVKLAEIYHVDLDPDRHIVRVNRGRRDCVDLNLPVIDPEGVFGQVISVTEYYSTIRLITDRNHIVPVQFRGRKNSVPGKELRTIAIGTGDSKLLKLPYISTSEVIEIGDEVVTSGLGQVYPYGYSVGRVVRIETSPGSKFQLVYIKPSASLDRTREVLLVYTDDPLRRRDLAIKIDKTGKISCKALLGLSRKVKQNGKH